MTRLSDNDTLQMFTALLVLFVSRVVISHDVLESYRRDRAQILAQEHEMGVGGNISLTPAEILANQKLMALKHAEIDEGFSSPHYFNFSRHYFEYRQEINSSAVYHIIRQMPKGAALHVHASMMLGPDYILDLTYEDYLYVCFHDDTIDLLFSYSVPQRPCSSKWELMREARVASGDVKRFDDDLRKYFTLYTDGQDLIKSDINSVWKKFNTVYHAMSGLLAYRPAREKFFYGALKHFYDDNIMYIEIRSGLRNLYELNGTKHDRLYMAHLYDKVTKDFMREHSDFIGVKLIVTRHRACGVEKISDAIELARQVKAELPHFFAGFDLVGQEDLGRPLTDFLPLLAKAKHEMDFFFHAGETNWSGTTSDENLVDAILLGAKRIGHGYALLKHPALIEAVKAKNIGIEVNVVSNNVLSLVSDVRNHPLAAFLTMGLPVVLSSDDPGVWEADPLSHDFYITFVGVASRRADLRTLKQLSLNSIHYSTMNSDQKAKALDLFRVKWRKFIHDVNNIII